MIARISDKLDLVKIDETGDLVIARIMTGSMSDKLDKFIVNSKDR